MMGRRALVVDDDAQVLELVASMLEELGCKTVLARSGTEALGTIANDQTIDVLVADITMPGLAGSALSGWKYVGSHRHWDAPRPAILVRAFERHADAMRPADHGVSGAANHQSNSFSKVTTTRRLSQRQVVCVGPRASDCLVDDDPLRSNGGAQIAESDAP